MVEGHTGIRLIKGHDVPSPLTQSLLFIEAAWKSIRTCAHDLTTTVNSMQESGRAWLLI